MQTLSKNKKVQFDYSIEDSMVAGIKLEGWEVKPILNGKMSIAESYVRLIDGALYIVGSNVAPENQTNFVECDNTRSRKLLLTKKQQEKWVDKVKLSGYTIMVSGIHYSDSLKIKANICLCKGKKLYDKRASIKEADIQRRKWLD